MRSGCPISRARGSCIKCWAFRIELEFRNAGFCGGGKTGVPREKPLGAEKRTNNKLNPYMTSSPGIEPRPHWWKASALTTGPSLLPADSVGLIYPSSETQMQSVGSEEKVQRTFSSMEGRAPWYWLLPNHFQMVHRMLAPDWTQKMF